MPKPKTPSQLVKGVRLLVSIGSGVPTIRTVDRAERVGAMWVIQFVDGAAIRRPASAVLKVCD